MGSWAVEAVEIGTERLVLRHLAVEDADGMVGVLADERLHEFIGGRPANLDELRDRYRRLAAGSPDEDQVWLNWIACRRADARPVGTLQATLTDPGDGRPWTAQVAWVVGVDLQGRGFASEAARALVGWLQDRGVATVEAHIHADHRASAAVATRAGLRPTAEEVDGEQVWRISALPVDE
jgi:RimJ/RimL family protein N-acetyltransferase